MQVLRAIPLVIAGVAAFPAMAAGASPEVNDKYHVTAGEKAACTRDAVRLCFSTYPDEDRLLACMKENRGSLSPGCRVAFDAGMRRRHL